MERSESGRDGSATIAEVVFAAEDTRVILAVDASLAGEVTAADELTDAATHAASPGELVDDVRDVADALACGLRVERQGTTDTLTLRED